MDDLELHAPQWVDFTTTDSPIQAQDFFEKSHKLHERIEDFDETITNNTESFQSMLQVDVASTSTKVQDELNIIKSTPIKVISPNHSKKEVLETTYDQLLSNAMRNLELGKKPKIVQESVNQESNAFKTPNVSKITKLSKSISCHSVPNKCVKSLQDSGTKSMKMNSTVVANQNKSKTMKEKSVNQVLFKEHEIIQNDTAKRLNENKQPNEDTDVKKYYEEDNDKHENGIEELNGTNDEKHNEENINQLQNESEKSTDSDKKPKEEDNQNVHATINKSNRSYARPPCKNTVLTWHNHRPSLQKQKMPVNKKYVSLAEAVSRFQNETPERFRTKSSKLNNTIIPLNMTKSMQNRLKPTIPISPALLSKTRARPVTVLSREEREKLEMEEMKKYQIKANPIPPNVLRQSRMVAKITAKKSTTVAGNSTQSNEKANATNVSKSQLHHRNKVSTVSKGIVGEVLETDPSGFVVEQEEMTFFGVPKDTGVTKNVTRVKPFSFEERNKNLQMKKEQRLKNLQEENKVKSEFHARPVPNFSKPPTPPAKLPQQQGQNTKKIVLPCPFSFDDRNKKALERKEQLVKQVLEEGKQARVFRANPVPTFKPVMVRGRSKELLLAKDKNMANEHMENQENKEPNIDFSKKKEQDSVPKLKAGLYAADKQKAPSKIYSFKLNTDKRAKERYEFNEKMKRKEMEEEIKRLEAEKMKVESEKEMKAKLRKLAEVKARPMPVYKPPVIMKATKSLTNPQSPAFASKLRSK
ncbi:hypothetical protein PUN28_005433 [Cardiocondyla obscurior]|uniref:TPX2 C-terminal domain-containing protein n=1 Tax=Cardiocondyla obscurior TaxID=286306 RepID=A0AAW2GHV0_9HYME